jgi:DNA (cytosine-5)-methyltransferase 1
MKAVELFAGAGGLALGVALAGFRHLLMVELNPIACATLRLNCRTGVLLTPETAILESDTRNVDYATLGAMDLVAGGPPCQPFSLGGKHHGHLDNRDMFPEAIRAVRELRPKAFLFENVKGLMRSSFAHYLRYVVMQLTYPELQLRPKEDWTAHLQRLERYPGGCEAEAEYDVSVQLLNAADYGVPQRRERVFIIGIRRDLGVRWVFPPRTHCGQVLQYQQRVTGEYWERHGIAPSHAATPDVSRRYLQQRAFPAELAWRTVRDAISHLPPPDGLSNEEDHRLVEGARSYKGHTGSRYDEPAKTLKAGDHGVPGGENTLDLGNHRVRYFTVRECACLQTFPDDYRFTGSWTDRMRQIGNAVPPVLAALLAKRIYDLLATHSSIQTSQQSSRVASSSLSTD